MSVVLMSKRELNRLDVLARLESGRLTAAAAAELMRVSERQMYRLLSRFREAVRLAIADRAAAAPQTTACRMSFAIMRSLWCGSTTRISARPWRPRSLAERHDLRVSRETLRSWMVQAGIWRPRAERKRIQQPRHRREHVGELVQIDGWEHRWFEDRAAALHVSGVRRRCDQPPDGAALCASESTFAYFEVLQAYLEAHGKPVAFYSDKHSIFRVSRRRTRQAATE